MKRSVYKILPVAALMAMVFLGVSYAQEFRFYNIEASDLFLYDRYDIIGKLGSTGGFALVVSSFMTQFMKIPYAGPVIVTLIYLAVGLLLSSMIRGKEGGIAVSGLAFVPVAFLFLCLENDYYRFHGHVAFLIVIIALRLFFLIPSGRSMVRKTAALAAVPVLYFMTGSVSVVFAAVIAVSEIIDEGVNGLWSLACPVLFFLTAYVFMSLSLADSPEAAFTPFMYYSWPSTYFFPMYAWASVPLLWIAAFAVSRVRISPRMTAAASACGLAVSMFIAVNLWSQVHSEENYRMLQEQRWAQKGEWDKIIETADRRRPTYLVSYVNLALAMKGQLVERYTWFNPQSLKSIMLPTPIIKNGLSLQSEVYLAWGYLAAARQAAFDANTVTPQSCNPRQLDILIRTNLVMGAHDVAEKYISILEKTLFYRDYAERMKRFVGDPEAVLRDAELGNLASAVIIPDSGYLRKEGLKGDMRAILETDPSRSVLAQFYEVYEQIEKKK